VAVITIANMITMVDALTKITGASYSSASATVLADI